MSCTSRSRNFARASRTERQEIVNALRQHLVQIRDRRNSGTYGPMSSRSANLAIGGLHDADQETGVPRETAAYTCQLKRP